jgi:hypothetical protein
MIGLLSGDTSLTDLPHMLSSFSYSFNIGSAILESMDSLEWVV